MISYHIISYHIIIRIDAILFYTALYYTSLAYSFLVYLDCTLIIFPRGGIAALVLLNSIDIGMETAHTDGLQDWDAIKVSTL